MDVKRYTPCNIGRTINRPILLGKVGEINALRIEFDCEEWLTDYPDAAVELFVKRPDNDKYHPALGEDGYVRIWIIDERAVLAAGSGVIELELQDASSGTRIKSATGYTTVVSSPSAEGEASDLGFVAYSRTQNLTEAQKRQARNNIGAGTGTGTGTGSGTDGFSPTIKVEKIDGGNRLTITDIDGEKVVDVMDGKNGKNGDPGEDGRGIESVVRTSGDGSPGSTDVYTITYTDGYTSTLTVYNGKDGAAGEDGVSPTVAVETIDGGHRVTITSADNPKSFEVMDGKTGAPGEPGKDYVLTEADKEEIAEMAAEKVEVPEGSSYTLPIASPTTLGGVKPAAKTDDMTQEVGVDEQGGLWAPPSGGSEKAWTLISDVTLEGEEQAASIGTPTEAEMEGYEEIYCIIKTLTKTKDGENTTTSASMRIVMADYNWKAVQYGRSCGDMANCIGHTTDLRTAVVYVRFLKEIGAIIGFGDNVIYTINGFANIRWSPDVLKLPSMPRLVFNNSDNRYYIAGTRVQVYAR